MKRYLILVLSIVLLLFSFLYYKRIDKITIYSRYETQFINKNSEEFGLNLYVNKEKSIYSNPNYINFEIYLNDTMNKLTLKSVNTTLEESLYKITYNFQMLQIKAGNYESKLVLKTNEEKLEFNMGNIYFKDVVTKGSNYSFVYNLQDNIKEIHIVLDDTKKLEKVLINGKSTQTSVNYNNLQEMQELVLYPYNNTYLSSLLINIDDLYYLIVNDKISNFYFIEATYVDL